MGEQIIRVEHITKAYGTNVVLNDVSVSFEKGMITGIVGRNGSGKTVLLKCILGLTSVTKGEITVYGRRIGKDVDFAPNVGFIINMPGFLSNASGYTNLSYLASINKRIGKKEIVEALEIVGLDPQSRKKVGKYSLGMRQRLAIAQALMEDPDILILDEPMNSLDNASVIEMRKLFASLANKGKTIIITSHNHEDVEALCHTVFEMDHGSISQRGEQ